MNKAILAGVSAMALLAVSNGASAQTVLNSGGGTLAAIVYRNIFNCYSSNTATNEFLSTSATQTEYQAAYTMGTPSISVPTGLPSACTSGYVPTVNVAIDYLPVGSGAGQKAFTYYSPASWGTPAVGNPVAWLSDALSITTAAAAQSEFDFSGSDAGLSSTQISSAATGHGAVVQFPAVLTTIDLSVYNGGSKKNAVKLTTAQICGIFSGTITNWSGIASPGNKGTNTGTIIPVVRADGSGTSYIFSNYLSLVCPHVSPAITSFTSANGFPSTAPNWSAAAVAASGTFVNFVSASGSGGVAGYVNSTANSINYISPDYVDNNGYTATIAAEVQYPSSSSAAKFVAPSYKGAAALAGGSVSIPTTAYNWGQPLNNAVLALNLPLDDSNGQFPKSAYPIAGYTFIETYACPAQPAAVKALWSWYFAQTTSQSPNPGYKFVSTYLETQGFAALPIVKNGINLPNAVLNSQISQIGVGCG